MRSKVCRAVRNRSVLEFRYRNQPRIVEPHKVGISTAGNDVLDGFQIGGRGNEINPPDWGLYKLTKMSGLRVTDRSFSGTRPKYDSDDDRMTHIYCRL